MLKCASSSHWNPFATYAKETRAEYKNTVTELWVISTIDSRGAGGVRAPPEFGGLEKGQSLNSAYRSLAITTKPPGFKKLSTALFQTGPHSTVNMDPEISTLLYGI